MGKPRNTGTWRHPCLIFLQSVLEVEVGQRLAMHSPVLGLAQGELEEEAITSVLNGCEGEGWDVGYQAPWMACRPETSINWDGEGDRG